MESEEDVELEESDVDVEELEGEEDEEDELEDEEDEVEDELEEDELEGGDEELEVESSSFIAAWTDAAATPAGHLQSVAGTSSAAIFPAQ